MNEDKFENLKEDVLKMNNADDDDRAGLLMRKMFDTMDSIEYMEKRTNILVNNDLAYFTIPEKKDYDKCLMFAKVTMMTIKEKILKIEPELLSLVQDSDSTYDKLYLPYNNFFINNDFHDENGNHYKGIAVITQPDGSEVDIVSTALNPNNEELTICAVYNNEARPPAQEFLKKVVRNIVTMINSEKEIEVFEQHIDEMTNKNRIKRGKSPRSNFTYIRTTGKLKDYVKNYSLYRTPQNICYLVRGHFRHYTSDFYKAMKGKKEWVKPFFRGKGMYINNEVVVKQ